MGELRFDLYSLTAVPSHVLHAVAAHQSNVENPNFVENQVFSLHIGLNKG
jgi:hypothetical protein